MEQPVSVENMDEGEEGEEMDQTTPSPPHPSLPTSVIVSVAPNVESTSSFTSPPPRISPTHSPLFQVVSPDHRAEHRPVHHHLLSTRQHLQVRQTLSEPGRNGRGHKAKVARLSPTRLSPIQPRKNDPLSKTLSMGAALDTAPNSVIWKPVDTSNTESMQSEGGGDSPNSTPSVSPLSLTANTRIPYMLGTSTPSAAAGQMVSHEQLEALCKQLPASSEQLELVQKQMLALMEQNQKMASLGLSMTQAGGGTATGGGGVAATAPLSTATAERIQLPLLWFGVPGGITSTTPFSFPTTSSSNNATPSPTASISSNDSGLSGMSQLSGLSGIALQAQPSLSAPAREPLSLGSVQQQQQQRRPLSESQSAPGFQTVPDSQFEALQKQFQIQQQQLLLQSQQINQHYLEQQQRLLAAAVLERKQFEEQQRQLSALHLRQQTELQKKQQLLRQMQEAQLITMQRQQQALLLQSLQQTQQQQQRQASQLAQVQQATPISMPHPQTSPQPNHKLAVRRVSLKESVSLPFSKPTLSATSSTNSLQEIEMGHRSLGASDLQGHSPNLTPKASLTPTNSYESATSSNNGRLSPNVVSPLSSNQDPPQQGGTGLVYDSMMLKHGCNCGGSHPDHPGRLQSIWARLMETRVVENCRRLRARKASLAELQTIHSENHVRLYGRPTQRRQGQEKKDTGRAFVQLSCGGVGVDRDTYWNDAHTSNASRMAAGSVIELADKVVNGEVKNGFALIRPPGHHALPNQAQAFCYFNNVAVAAKAMLSKGKKVMILDWDIHHGNGTQQIFYDNPNILYMSIHRYDNGTFFPGTGRPEEIGSGAGLGFNVNIAFSGPANFQGMSASNFGDVEYLSAFRSIVIPIAREFAPDLILVSAGFNATDGHPPTLGGYSLSTKCYAHMTRMVMGVGSGRVAMALEGGYELMSLCSSAEACMRALLGLELPQLDSSVLERPPQAAAVSSMEKTVTYQKSYWPCLSRSAHLLPLSQMEAEKREVEEADTVTALASLSVGGAQHHQRILAVQTAV